MSRMGSQAGIVLVAGLLLTLASGALAQGLPKDGQKCISGMNKAGAKVAAAQAKVHSTCLKDALKGRIAGSVEPCLTSDPKGRVAKAAAKTFKREQLCPLPPPLFGFTDADTVIAAAVDQELSLIHDIFGSDLDSSIGEGGVDTAHRPSGGLQGACRASVLKAYGKLRAAKLKAFASCKKAALGGKNGPAVTTAQELQDRCMGIGTGNIPDPKGKIAKAGFKLVGAVEKCLSSGVQLDTAFPGACFSALDAPAFASCVDARVECRVCLMLNLMDALSRDCDEFDNGVADGSCSDATGTHKCTLDNDPNTFEFLIHTEGLPPLPASLEGSIDISCGSVDLDTGKASCTCTLQDLSPIVLPGIGSLCLTPGGTCPAGEIDCDGGNDLQWDILADHNIGACTGNADCDAQCAIYCSNAGYGVKADQQQACGGFCNGGANADAACTLDADCLPGGACNGTDLLPHGNACGCQCLRMIGPPSGPGDLKCQIPTEINVVLGPLCPGLVLIALGTVCIPVSTQSVENLSLNANDGIGVIGPFSIEGAPVDCLDLETSVTSGMEIVGQVDFFDFPIIGDIKAQTFFNCQ